MQEDNDVDAVSIGQGGVHGAPNMIMDVTTSKPSTKSGRGRPKMKKA